VGCKVDYLKFIPENCKFPCEVDRVELLQAIEILDVTEKARESIKGVEIWSNK